jgi:ELWxxDGT repeat protein
MPLKDFWTEDAYYAPFDCVGFKNWVYFTGNNNTYGFELWRSDGTPQGTTPVVAVEPEAGTIFHVGIEWLTVVEDTLYFTAYDSLHGRELWKSDGTAPGTLRLKDINLGSNGSYPQNLTAVLGKLYFTADDGIHGRELWQSDGTPEGTIMVADIYSGTNSSQPTDLSLFTSRSRSTLFFQADDGEHGSELWAILIDTYTHESLLPVVFKRHY